MGRLSTHILGTFSGQPATGVRVVLRDDTMPVDTRTSADGRTGKTFYLVDCCRAERRPFVEPPLQDVVPLRLAIAEDSNHHVTLLVSPFGYSTRRGN